MANHTGNLQVISLEDITGYIQMKSVQDYTYEDAIAVVRSKEYEDVPMDFIIFMGRVLEDTAIRTQPFNDLKESQKKSSTISLKNYSFYPIRVQYRQGGSVHIQEYQTDYVVNDLTKEELRVFIAEYMERVIGDLGKTSRLDYHEDLFQMIRWVEVYISDRYGGKPEVSKAKWERRFSVNVDKVVKRHTGGVGIGE